MTEIMSAEELARLNALIDPARAMRSSKKIADHLRERQAAWARGDMSSMSGKMLALAAAALDAQRDALASLTRELEEAEKVLEQLGKDANVFVEFVLRHTSPARAKSRSYEENFSILLYHPFVSEHSGALPEHSLSRARSEEDETP